MDYSKYFAKFFGVVAQGQTYLNALYLLLSFPLGIGYFVFLVTGISLGFSLLIIWVGLFVLAAVYASLYGFILFERQMAVWMLHEEIPPVFREDLSGLNLWQKFTATLKNPVTWKGLAFLFAKFPLGIISFVVLVTLLAMSFSLMAMPFIYKYTYTTVDFSLWFTANNQVWVVDTLNKAITVSLLGVILAFASLHAFNGLAWVSGKFARIMLSSPSVSAMPNLLETPTAPVVLENPAVDEPSSHPVIN
jgi:hypothetical protein